ncbi:helix-turn-helix domain-containing protein [Pelagicoccus sp. NFK12]|uniref:Helix-turn-helix domain-containing protein n=1 Tax=Pelagicoccus enzymogenes TaxID=2773457 RepID=A0A927II22_9BACT|nr:AraC family transcriptional regulator [Pelagicoccus enzymogenes]MBD5780045.1 helix-turn-helix domain-containing protein [Pelagicoccus enzymogenes]
MPPITSDDVEASTEFTPAVCRAGYLQFSGNRNFTNPCVQSRAFFWCKSGKGSFLVNGHEYTLEAQDLYLLPWNRSIQYQPDRDDPMFTGHVHLVPDYRPGSRWVPNVPHQPSDEGYNSPDRSDVDWPELEGVVHFKINAGDNIALLLDYTIRSFLRSKGSNESEARHLGSLLVGELLRLKNTDHTAAQRYPEELLRMVAHVEARYMRSITVSELADMIGRSRSHVLKLFRHHMGISAKHYIINRQLKQACELLLSTTRSIAEVGQAVGISDPYHFSKLFRRHLKVSPSSFRTNHGPISQPSETHS